MCGETAALGFLPPFFFRAIITDGFNTAERIILTFRTVAPPKNILKSFPEIHAAASFALRCAAST
jgi:hypothetical protein